MRYRLSITKPEPELTVTSDKESYLLETNGTTELKRKLDFRPEVLLCAVVGVFAHFSGNAAFAGAIAAEERFGKAVQGNLASAAEIVRRPVCVRARPEVAVLAPQLLALQQRVAAAAAQLSAEDFSEIEPDAFLDPIVYSPSR